MAKLRNYFLLLASQFLSAFGDSAIWVVILGQLTFEQKAGRLSEQQLSSTNAAYSCLLFLPYVLLAPWAGFMNDRYPKSRGLLLGNLIKLSGAVVASLSVAGVGSLWQGLGYLIVGIGACLYSPAKYGILPEILPAERLVKANGVLEMLTLVAILTGLIFGATLIDRWPVIICYGVIWMIFGAATILNAWMTSTPAHPDVELMVSLREFGGHFRLLFSKSRLAWILVGTSLFWVCASVIKINFQSWGLNSLNLPDNKSIALLNLWLAVGVMTGSILAGDFHSVGDLRGTRFYGLLLAGFITWLGGIDAQTDQGILILALMLAGASGGLFLIPLDAALQAESDQRKLGKTIAIQNFLNNLGMMLGGAVIWLGAKAGNSASENLLLTSGLVAVVCLFLNIPARPAPPVDGSYP